jgi:hypothetical protein
MMEQEYELKTSLGKVIWYGTSGENAAQRWADCHPGECVTAWRYPKTELRIGMIQIVKD